MKKFLIAAATLAAVGGASAATTIPCKLDANSPSGNAVCTIENSTQLVELARVATGIAAPELSTLRYIPRAGVMLSANLKTAAVEDPVRMPVADATAGQQIHTQLRVFTEGRGKWLPVPVVLSIEGEAGQAQSAATVSKAASGGVPCKLAGNPGALNSACTVSVANIAEAIPASWKGDVRLVTVSLVAEGDDRMNAQSFTEIDRTSAKQVVPVPFGSKGAQEAYLQLLAEDNSVLKQKRIVLAVR